MGDYSALLTDENFWVSRVLSALRTGVACLLVLIGLSLANSYVTFPVFGYVVAILVLSESTLGKSLEDGLFAFLGGAQAAIVATVVLHIIGRENVSLGVCLTCIFTGSYIFTCFPGQRAVKKRLSLALTTIIFVTAYNDPHRMHPVIFPLRLIATTAIGVISAIISLLFPVPRVSAYQTWHKSRMCEKLATDQFKLLSKAFFCNDVGDFQKTASELKLLSRSWLSALAEFEQKQAEAEWEPRILRYPITSTSEQMSGLKSGLWGMTIALEEGLFIIMGENRKETKDLKNEKRVFSLLSAFPTVGVCCKSRFRGLFFLFAARKFLENSSTQVNSPGNQDDNSQQPSPCGSCLRKAADAAGDSGGNSPMCLRFIEWVNISTGGINKRSTIESLKVAISMTTAVYLGLLYRRDYGYWSTITVALGLFNSKSGLFTSTGLRLQGTALGTVYGYLVALLTRQALVSTIAMMLPWVVLTSFLRSSKHLRLTGASTTLTSALIILGKRRPGDVQDFAVLRMTQALLGLGAFMIVEAIMFPRRAGLELLPRELELNLGRFQGFLQELIDSAAGDLCDECSRSKRGVIEKRIRAGNSLQEGLAREAKAEPDLWYEPCEVDVFEKLTECQTRMVEFLHFMASASAEIHSLTAGNDSGAFAAALEQKMKMLQSDLFLVSDFIQRSLELGRGKIVDLEKQESASSMAVPASCIMNSDSEEKIYNTFHELLLLQMPSFGEDKKMKHSKVELCAGAFAFSCAGFGKEILQLQRLVQELLMRKQNH